MERFDTELFITAIQERPVLWDFRMPLHSSRAARNKAWMDICSIFYRDFAQKSNKEKYFAVIEMQKKWKSVKDAYNRQKAKFKSGPNGTESRPLKQYIYYKQLSFLQVLNKHKPSNPPRQPAEVSDNEDDDDNEEGCLVPVRKTKKSSKCSNHEDNEKPGQREGHEAQETFYERLLDKLNKCTPTVQHPDEHFLLSLIPHFNTINSKYKLDAKADIINLLRKYNSMDDQAEVLNPLSPVTSPGSSSNIEHVVIKEETE